MTKKWDLFFSSSWSITFLTLLWIKNGMGEFFFCQGGNAQTLDVNNRANGPLPPPYVWSLVPWVSIGIIFMYRYKQYKFFFGLPVSLAVHLTVYREIGFFYRYERHTGGDPACTDTISGDKSVRYQIKYWCPCKLNKLNPA